jgi:outer membrane protein assembly factor BamD
MSRKIHPAARPLVFSLLISLSIVGAFTRCASKAVNESDPASLYQDAEEEIKSDHYQMAIEKLRMIKNKFPYSKYSLQAQLRMADVLFMQELYSEAAVSYEAFRDLHPKHEKVGYAMFRTAKSHFNDIPSPISRDLTPAYKAQEAYNDFLKRFPQAPEAEEGRKDLAETRRILSEKELYIADFYAKRDFAESAKPRYEKVIALYPETAAAKTAGEKLPKIEKQAEEQKAKRAKEEAKAAEEKEKAKKS